VASAEAVSDGYRVFRGAARPRRCTSALRCVVISRQAKKPWPENQTWPALQMGPFVGFITTTASMVAFINSIVAAVGVAMFAGQLLREKQTLLASLIGAGVALALMAGFVVYQKWRYDSARS